MLSSVLNSQTAVNININIMRAFVELRKLTQLATASYQTLQREIDEVKEYIEDILHDQNDINESTRAQLDAISTALTELQSKEPRKRRPIGFIVADEKEK
jgi:predicted DNA-binding ArsR family transcriptional regulator